MFKYLTRLLPALVLIMLIVASCNDQPQAQYPLVVEELDSTTAQEVVDRIMDEVAIQVADGLQMDLWASDSLLTDPVAISVDPYGGVYYNNGTRIENSEFDIRGHRDWMTQSISFQSVEDRRNFLRSTFAPELSEMNSDMLEDLNGDGSHDWRDLTVEKESVWRLEDRDRDGYADRAQLFIEDFHEEITDLANGVEYSDGDVFVSVGPDLWRTRDRDGDGIADEKESLAHGFGVHIGFGAHGMSGPIRGPDGRIWWGIGDIGMNVTDREGNHWMYPNQGVIVRCETDGTGFEVYAAGLRNTHEFVFDEYGNLITEDNDGDHAGERERLVYITYGSDGGWRINWQFGKYTDPDNNAYKVWMDERLHVPRWDGQAAYITPPIINYVNGPTGLVYNPGTALSDAWKNFFFIAEFRGTPANSPVHAFKLKPVGASFELDTTIEIVKGILPTGLDFSPDGQLYIADWIDGWNVKEKGRIWKLDVSGAASSLRNETMLLLQADFGEKSNPELGALLQHPDMRIRQKAQFELAENKNGTNTLIEATRQTENQVARIHGIWGIAQQARKKPDLAQALTDLLGDPDPEIIAQAAKMIGDVRYNGAEDKLIERLSHPYPRARFFAAEALGRTKSQAAVPHIIGMLIENQDKDAWLRHAGVYALAQIGDASTLIDLKDHPSESARIAGVVALRRMKHPGIHHFLHDPEEYIVTEAARGINDDFSIEEALPHLADILNQTPFHNEPLIRRAVNANLRVGKPENLAQLKAYALDDRVPDLLRAEALAALSTWANPSPLDRVDGRYRGKIERNPEPLLDILEPALQELFESAEKELLVESIKACQRVDLKSLSNHILTVIQEGREKNAVLAGLDCLQSFDSEDLLHALKHSLNQTDQEVRAKALSIIPSSELDVKDAVELYERVLQTGSTTEMQAVYAGLTKMPTQASSGIILPALRSIKNKRFAPELILDVLEAAEGIDHPEVISILDQINAGFDSDPMAKYKGALYGGNVDRGRNIFFRHEAAQCVRCHSIFEWGGDAGPNLDGVGSRLQPEQIVESLIEPSAQFAPDWGIVSLELEPGEIVTGYLQEESNGSLLIRTVDQKQITIEKDRITRRTNIPSSMPSVKNVLTARELRDLVAFLTELKTEI